MLVSIVTVLSRLPSLAATMEAKFSAPAESKAMVNLPVLIHLEFTSFFFTYPSLICSSCRCNVISATEMWFQAVYFDPVCGFCFSPSFSLHCVFFFLIFKIRFLEKSVHFHYHYTFVSSFCFWMFLIKSSQMNVVHLSFCWHILHCIFLWFQYLPFIMSFSKWLAFSSVLHRNTSSCCFTYTDPLKRSPGNHLIILTCSQILVNLS